MNFNILYGAHHVMIIIIIHSNNISKHKIQNCKYSLDLKHAWSGGLRSNYDDDRHQQI